MNLVQQHEHYKAVRERLTGKPRVINLIAEERNRIEAYRRKEREAWELAQKRLMEAERQAKAEEEARQEVVEAITDKQFTTHASLTVGFTEYQNPTTIQIPAKYVRRTMLEIARDVLRSFPGISLEDVQGDDRHFNIMIARRHVIANIKLQRPDVSFPAIGRFVKKDHTTCLHAMRRFTEEHLGKVAE